MASGVCSHPGEALGREDARPRAALDDAERELSVLSAILKSLTMWEGFARGSERLLRELAGALGQMAGTLWLPRGQLLCAGAVWSLPSVDGDALARALGEARVTRGVGLAGRAWERREAVDRPTAAGDDGGATRKRLPQGLAPMIAVPCSQGEEVLGVIELYSSARAEMSSHLMQVLAFAGRDLGLFFARRRGQLTPSSLSPREAQVLALAGGGQSVREIGESLTISPATVKTHLEHIYRKLGVHDRTAAVAHALRGGFIE
jgi:DNA-binding CsgD family transcriptional regulator